MIIFTKPKKAAKKPNNTVKDFRKLAKPQNLIQAAKNAAYGYQNQKDSKKPYAISKGKVLEVELISK